MTTLYMLPLSELIQYFTDKGIIAAGASVQTNVAGTVSTPITTYTDSTGLVQNPNPMTLSSAGRPAGASGALVAFWVPAGSAVDAIFTDVQGDTWALRNMQGINDPSFSTSTIATELANPASAGVYPVGGADFVANAVKSYDVIADVRAAATPVLTGVQTLVIEVEGGAAVGDGLGGEFYYNATSAAVDPGGSNTNVIKNTGNAGNGRFLRMSTPPFGAQSTIASAATTDLGTLATNLVSITGVTTITSFGSSANVARPLYVLGFTGILTLTYNAVSLVIPGNMNITTAAGDTALATYAGGGNWVILAYFRATGGIGSGGGILSTQTSVLAADSAAVNNSIAFINSGLSLSLQPGTYLIEQNLLMNGAAAGMGYQTQWTFSGTIAGAATGTWIRTLAAVASAGLTQNITNAIGGASVETGGINDAVASWVSVVVTVAGTLNVQFSQSAATVGNLVMKAGSTIIATRVL